MRVFAVISSILLLALFAGSIAHAQQVKTDLPVKSPVVANPKDPAAKDPIKRPGKPGGDQFALTPEREAAAMTFGKRVHEAAMKVQTTGRPFLGAEVSKIVNSG